MSKFLTIDSTNKASIEAGASNGDAYFNTDSSEVWVWDSTLTIPDWRRYASSGLANTFPNSFSTNFSASTSYVNFPTMNTTIYGVSVWFKPNSTITSSNSAQTIFNNGDGSGYYPGLGSTTSGNMASTASSNELVGVLLSSRGVFGAAGADGMPSQIDTNWHHILLSWENDLSVADSSLSGKSWYRLFFDGVEVGKTESQYLMSTGLTPKVANGNAVLGRRSAGSMVFDGYIDEFAIYTEAPVSEISNIYDSADPKPVNLNDLTIKPYHWYRMGDLQSGAAAGNSMSTISDIGQASLSGSGADGVVTDATVAEEAP